MRNLLDVDSDEFTSSSGIHHFAFIIENLHR